MPLEIEKKFLVNESILSLPKEFKYLKQGYLLNERNKTVRIRISNNEAFITIKSGVSSITRSEYEYKIPIQDAQEMLLLCPKSLEKKRYHINYEGFLWEVDVFLGENEGLIVAEIELEDENQEFKIPEWAVKEVSNDHRYLNANLIRNPFCEWL